MRDYFTFPIMFCALAALLCGGDVRAQEGIGAANMAHMADQHEAQHAASRLTDRQKRALALSFVSRMKESLREADVFLGNHVRPTLDPDRYPDGEILFLQVNLKHGLVTEDLILSKFSSGHMYLSLRDFFAALKLAVDVDVDAGTASGWYIRETYPFVLDFAAKQVETHRGVFDIKETNAFVEEGDLWVRYDILSEWMDFGLELEPAGSVLRVRPFQMLPMLEAIERRAWEARTGGVPPVELPRMDENKRLIDVPFADISLRATYDKDGEGNTETRRSYSGSMITAGDFAYGTLETISTYTRENKLNFFNATYEQESLEPDLLGPLKARRLELGAVGPAELPFVSDSGQNLGVRVTNIDPLRGTIRAATRIAGRGIPGWDIELFREGTLVEIQTIGEDGQYLFDDVSLLTDDTNFTLVFYGPQGEVREEKLTVPVDNDRLSKTGAVYDVAVRFNDTQIYNFRDIETEDQDTLNITALYERPVGDKTAAFGGFETTQQDGERDTYLTAGFQTTVADSLLNGVLTVDDGGEQRADLTARRDFGDSELRYSMNWQSEHFGVQAKDLRDDPDKDDSSLSNTINYRGRTQLFSDQYDDFTYVANLNNRINDQGSIWRGTGSLGLRLGRVNVNQNLRYETADYRDEDEFTAFTNVRTGFGRNRFLLRAGYDLHPDAVLERATAEWERKIDDDLDLTLGIEREIERKLTTGSARIDWRTPYAFISPSIRYNSDNDIQAVLNTRFGLSYDKQGQVIHATNENISARGGLSVLVYVDHNGNLIYDEGDEPVPDVRITLPQNSVNMTTGAEGYAFSPELRENIVTDVKLLTESLQDPFWIAAREGHSVVPREGYIYEMEFPVHVAGEMDGIVYERYPDGAKIPRRGVTLHLYDMEGRSELSVRSGPDGFYLFNLIPPGQYLLVADERTVPDNMARPKPQKVEIGYDGTIIYGRNIYLDVETPDVPSEVLPSLVDFRSQHPHVPFGAEPDMALNLGGYNSRLLMAMRWYELRRRYGALLAGSELMVPPAESYADPQTGLHTLRVALPAGESMDDAYARCRALMARALPCKVELLPGMLEKQAFLQSDALQDPAL